MVILSALLYNSLKALFSANSWSSGVWTQEASCVLMDLDGWSFKGKLDAADTAVLVEMTEAEAAEVVFMVEAEEAREGANVEADAAWITLYALYSMHCWRCIIC